MNVTTLLREAYPNALKGMFFRNASEEDLYRQYLTIMGNRLPAGDGHGLTTILRHEERTRFGRQMGPNLAVIYALKQGYTDDRFRELLIYLTGHTHYARDVQAIREHFMNNNLAQPDAVAAGDLAQLLQRYTGSDYVASGDTMQRFAKALVHLAGGSASMTYREALLGLDTNVSSKVRPEIAKWAKGIYPCWGDILKYTEQYYGQPAVHDALAEVGLRTPTRKQSRFRAAINARLSPDQRRQLVHDDFELGRRLLNNMCRFWGVDRPEHFVPGDHFLEMYLSRCDLLSRLPFQLADILRAFTRCKPSDRAWEPFFTLLEHSCRQPLYKMLQENYRDRNEDAYMLQEQLMFEQQVLLEKIKEIEKQSFPVFAVGAADVQYQAHAPTPQQAHLQRIVDAYASPRRTHAGLFPAGHHTTPSPARECVACTHEALEKEQKTMPSITDQKPSPLKNTANKIKAAVQHGTAVASADEMANAALLSVAEVVPEIQPLLQTELGTTIVKLGLGSMIIGAVEHDFVPLENTDHLEKGATLVVEAAARDGLQPLMAKLTPILVKLAAAGKKAFDEAAK